MKETNARYVGIDLAKRTMEVRFIDNASDRVKKWNGKTDWRGRARLYKQLQSGDLVDRPYSKRWYPGHSKSPIMSVLCSYFI